jgi:hypothetical protein
MKRRAAVPQEEAAAASVPAVTPSQSPQNPIEPSERGGLSGRLASKPRSREEAEARYVAARDEWTRAMRAAGSGRPADLASLALAQEAYEAAAHERERWAKDHGRVAIPVEPEARRNIDVAVGQELRWREVRAPHESKGLLGRLKRRVGR